MDEKLIEHEKALERLRALDEQSRYWQRAQEAASKDMEAIVQAVVSALRDISKPTG